MGINVDTKLSIFLIIFAAKSIRRLAVGLLLAFVASYGLSWLIVLCVGLALMSTIRLWNR